MTTNVTLSLPEELLREARHRAVDEGVSLSQYVVRLLRADVAGDDRAANAREHALGRLEQAYDLGTNGQITWARESLHER